MKKFIITLLVLLGAAILTPEVKAEPVASQDGPTCVTVGNVSITVTEREAPSISEVSITNYNRYRVTVSWSVWGTDANGNSRKVAGGTNSVSAADNQGYGASSRSFTCPKGITGLWVESSVQRCN